MSGRDGLVYGVSALRAAARGDRAVWALHRAALSVGIVPVVTVGAVAEAYRTAPRSERLDEFLVGTEVEPLDRDRSRGIGELASRCGTADLVATSTAEVAARRNGAVVSSRQAALRAAASALGHDLVQYSI